MTENWISGQCLRRGVAPDAGSVRHLHPPVGEFERELIAARFADSRRRLKARHLRFAGGIPFGYDSDRRTKQLVPNTGEAAVIRWMFSEAARGKKPSEIAGAAKSQGYRTKP